LPASPTLLLGGFFSFARNLISDLRLLISVLCALLFAVYPAAEAQQQTKASRIGFLSSLSPSVNTDRIEAFRQGLRELGYAEGKNIFIEYRWADGKPERLPDLATELVRLKLDVIVTTGPTPTRAAKAATKTIPIVMPWDYDPVSNGFVASLARPGGNITGLSTLAPEITGKQLELLKEIIPKLSRVAVFGTSTVPGNAEALKVTEAAARTLKVRLQYMDILRAKDIEPAFQAATRVRADAILALSSRLFFSHRVQVADLALRARLPAIYGEQELVDAGGLVTYGVSITDLFRRAAAYVDKILKGATPAEIPVEQPKKFELVINLKAAKQIGLTIPQSVLYRADRVIK
jgi:putative ABC transport system substrate-binding protein